MLQNEILYWCFSSEGGDGDLSALISSGSEGSKSQSLARFPLFPEMTGRKA